MSGGATLGPLGVNCGHMASALSATVSFQGAGRTQCYLPRGAKGIRVLLSGFWIAQTTPFETFLATPLPINLALEVNAPLPWIATTTYAPGQLVTSTIVSSQQQPFWVALTANTNSPPQSSNANWSFAH